MAPMTKVIKESSFQWNVKARQAFKEIKMRLAQASILALPSFKKTYEVKFDEPRG